MDSGIKIAKEIVYNIDESIKRIYWTNKEIEKWFGKCSAKEILKRGNSCFMNPCLDLTVASALMLKSKNLQYNLVIEELMPTEDFAFNRLHFVLEFKNNNQQYFLDYKRNNEVYIHKGFYKGRDDLETKQIIKMPDKKINLKKSPYEQINNSQLGNMLKDYSLKKTINRLKKDNLKENYKEFERRFGKKFNIKQI